ncbi:hypothetical protein [Sphaerisporangium siamense]|uniref:Uncharacterized protein n=1 Tax=Sphaerisporangium siamense TaxID=795645 RepID=A0A7W7DHJ5_9ACTN|nr:hypothetical protein [Sphaerisporangium siamense]MBB4706145.1 hypothetical protein [Sphaerisporangium siamense]
MLLRSAVHGGLAVAAWAMYETLMPRGLRGGRAPARARRIWVGEALGVTPKSLDAARRELLAAGECGPWLSRSAPRGAKRAVRHMALHVPAQTGEKFAAVPAWTLDLVHGGRHRPEGTISPDAWRLYGLGELERENAETFEASVRFLGKLLHASPDTGRRRAFELEASGLWQVAERPGGRLVIRPMQTPQEAFTAASAYAEHGRAQVVDPSQPSAFTPRNETHSPLATKRTPQESDLQESPLPESDDAPPAVGVVQVGRARARAADAGRVERSAPRKGPGRGSDPRAAEVYRQAVPAELAALIPAHGRRRVLAVLSAELVHREPGELAARIAARFESWRYRLAEVTDATAVAITLARRGYHCVDVRCEDHVRLDTGQRCSACAETAHEITKGRQTASDGPVIDDQPPPGRVIPASGSNAPTRPLSAAPPPLTDTCPRHPGARERADGECAGCWVDRIAIA